MKKFEIFVVTAPGLEKPLAAEMADQGFKKPKMMPGGVRFRGNWQDVWRANLSLRGAVRVLARIDNFQAMHLNQLERLIADMPWRQYLRTNVPLKVDVATQKSKIYHAGAAKERIERGLATAVGAPISAEADVVVKARIDNNMVTLSLDTTGESLHKRGHKSAVAKAPMRENMAAMFLRQLGFDGSQPVYDPMCGSGTFVIEAAEIAAGLLPGRSRSFAFQQLANFDVEAFDALRSTEATAPNARFYGSDKDAGAVRMAGENASRAEVADWVSFAQKNAGEITPPDGAPGILVVNPPYGARIGDKKGLFALYASFGKALTQHFSGWTVGIITTDTGLARATGLPLETPFATVAHGGLKVQLYTCEVP
jgi:putative N6-adenine-specific DNA methylase